MPRCGRRNALDGAAWAGRSRSAGAPQAHAEPSRSPAGADVDDRTSARSEERRVGKECRYREKCGHGQKTGMDLQGEGNGLLSSQDDAGLDELASTALGQ